jgi:chorismate lyase/3-hydroxybenzoate synthase
MDLLTFQQRVVDAYRAAFEQLESTRFAYPVRFWAFVPGIHDDLGAGLDRYMSFNAGRYKAFALRYGHPSSFGGSIPTASAVGIQGDRFVLHCLASDEPGQALENPRQVSAYHYSRRFGPMPPCFARATLLRRHSEQPLLLVGGTASITGEESRHAGDIEAQAGETFRNLASLVAAATGYHVSEHASSADVHEFLAAFRHLRVYYSQCADQAALLQLVRASFSSACRVEWLQASLCRAELQVEIEGVARELQAAGLLGRIGAWHVDNTTFAGR